MNKKQIIRLLVLLSFTANNFTISVDDVINKKTGHECIEHSEETIIRKNRIETAKALYYYKNVLNDNTIKADLLYFGGNVQASMKSDFGFGLGAVEANKAIIIGDKSVLFQQHLVNTPELHILNPKTKVHFSPMATKIGALYKAKTYMGSIECWLAKSAYGELTITDEVKKVKAYRFNGYYNNLSNALNTGINTTESLEELIEYLEKTLPQQKSKL